ncbi:hypothetical protein R1flu_019720 [Riccia fluitans]|uniref:Plastid lipid-associated protein/fibrillin conserved domain-containing protein n=1 Tax=Riccia fluitans TaxID=41844 RepID=A0ABD1ZKH9_9MARC
MVVSVQALGTPSLGACARWAIVQPVCVPGAERGNFCDVYRSRSNRFRSRALKSEKVCTIAYIGNRTVKCAASTSSAVQEAARSREEEALIEALLGIQGRGRVASPKQLEAVDEAVKTLEELGGLPDPTFSPLIEGRWQLMFTTRPGTASPIQRTFVGVDAFTVFQEIALSDTTDPRVSNIVRASESIGELKVQAAASRESGKRILFSFDQAAFDFKFLPFKVPYPVPFKLLGDEAKGWLDTTYLSPSGTIRISKGNKGSTFILQKGLDLRQELLQAIATGTDVEKAIEKLISINASKNPAELSGLIGQWRLLWSSQAENANWIQKASANLNNWQIYYDDEKLENLVEFLPGVKLRAGASVLPTSKERQDVNIKGASLELGPLRLPVNITGEGYVDILYLDSKLKISRGNRGSLFVHTRES